MAIFWNCVILYGLIETISYDNSLTLLGTYTTTTDEDNEEGL